MIMDCFIITQRIKIIKTYYINGVSATTTYRALRGFHYGPTTQAIDKIIKKFEETEVVTNNIAIVNESVAEDSNVSTPRRSQE